MHAICSYLPSSNAPICRLLIRNSLLETIGLRAILPYNLRYTQRTANHPGTFRRMFRASANIVCHAVGLPVNLRPYVSQHPLGHLPRVFAERSSAWRTILTRLELSRYSSVGKEQDTGKIPTMDRCADCNKKNQERKTRPSKEKATGPTRQGISAATVMVLYSIFKVRHLPGW
jgi:hypothetical protein